MKINEADHQIVDKRPHTIENKKYIVIRSRLMPLIHELLYFPCFLRYLHNIPVNPETPCHNRSFKQDSKANLGLRLQA